MVKYGFQDNFNIAFFNNKDGTILFNVDTSCNFKIERDNGITYVTFQDALLDLDVANKFLDGTYDDIDFKIIGNSTIRNSNEYGYIGDYSNDEYEFLQLVITHAEFESFSFDGSGYISAQPVLKFKVNGINKPFRIIGNGGKQ